jgi:hypothetical protein
VVHSSSELATMNPNQDDESVPSVAGTDTRGSEMTESVIDVLPRRSDGPLPGLSRSSAQAASGNTVC